MTQSCDVAIVGGGVVGSAIAYFLLGPMEFPGRVIVVEKDPTYAEAATSRSAGGIRQQFSTPENIAMSSFGASFVKACRRLSQRRGRGALHPFHRMGLSLPRHPGRACHPGGQSPDPAQPRRRYRPARPRRPSRRGFPGSRPTTSPRGTLGLSNEGWIDPYSLLQAFRRKARSLGGGLPDRRGRGHRAPRQPHRRPSPSPKAGASPAAAWWTAPAITPMRSRPWPGSSCRSGRASASSSSSTARSTSSGRRC